ncbi:MAG: SPFH domain-containing protein [Phycisphaerae bacterium]
MTNSSTHARSRKAALFGLILQTVAAIAVVTMAQLMKSVGLSALFWILTAGIPIWLALLLLFRQRELTTMEQLDLEELRRERETKGGEALFGEQSGGVYGFAVAKARLEWMERFLIPGFGLFVAAFMIAMGTWMFNNIRRVIDMSKENPIGDTEHVQIGVIILSIVTLLLFFCSRYATGLGRVREWQALRAGGSYMFGCTLAALAMVISFGIRLYQGNPEPEKYVALGILLLMVLLGIEAVFNFLLDIYRPKTPGTEPRAAFDSRLLGLISEPTGLTRSVAEAINYQFGFQVSQTWFYQLLQRTILPLIGAGALAVWALSCVVIVFPHEHAIIERFGRQLNADAPLGPGVHFKYPAPFEIAEKFATGEIKQFSIGYKVGDQPIKDKHDDDKSHDKVEIELWTDAKHSGREHFNFVVVPTSGDVPSSAPATQATDAGELTSKRTAVHLIRLEVFVQYRIIATKLAEYTQHAEDPSLIIRNVAWEEVTRVASNTNVDSLMGPMRQKMGDLLRDALNRRATALKLGIEVVDVGLLNVHPEKSVALAFRGVVTGQQERVAEIRKARLEEDKFLSQVVGNKQRALALSGAIQGVHEAEVRRSRAEQSLGESIKKVPDSLRQKLDALGAQFESKLEADRALELATVENERLHEEFELGIGRAVSVMRENDKQLEQVRERQKTATAALDAALRPIRDEIGKHLSGAAIDDYIAVTSGRVAIDFWNRDIEKHLSGIGGETAVKLAEAQARRWELEMRAAGELARVQNERYAYAANPKVYKARKYLETLVQGMRNARKYFLAFEPGDRKIQVWLDAQEQARPDLTNLPTRASE